MFSSLRLLMHPTRDITTNDKSRMGAITFYINFMFCVDGSENLCISLR